MAGVVVANQPGVYLVDADGNVVTLTDGATIGAAEALLIAGKDGTVARFVKVTAAGRAVVDGSEVTQPVSAAALPLPAGAATETTLAAASAKLPAALVGGRLDENIGAWMGSAAPTVGQKAMAESLPVVLSSDQAAIPVSQAPAEEATFTAIVKAVAPAAGKSLLALFNPAASGYVIKLREIYIRNAATTAVTGVAAEIGTYAIRAGGAALSAGTDVTPIAHDSADALPAGLLCKTGGTVAGESTPELDVMRMSTDDWGPGTLDVESNQQTVANYLPARVKRDSSQKPFTLRAGQGIHLKFVTSSTAGLLDVVFIFTKV